MINPKKNIQLIDRVPPDASEREHMYRFDRNERTTLFTHEEFQKILSTLTPYDFTPYGELESFYQAIAKWLQVERSNVLLASGSDTAIKAIFETFVEEGDHVLNTAPNYAMFSVYTKMFGATEVIKSYNEDLSLDTEHFIDLINEKTKLVIISNPGHTGTVVRESDLMRICETAARHQALFVVDEAYHHFYPKTMLSFTHQLQNLIVVRTFSKAFGLASLRIGLLIANAPLISNLYRVKLVHEITGVAAKVGTFMMNNLQIMQNYVEEVNQGKKILYENLGQLGMEVLESQANFVFFKLPGIYDSKKLVAELVKKDIYIKGPFKSPPFNDHLRITVGDSAQMVMFCNVVKEVLPKCLRG